jgi:hypothetical protein
MQHINITQHTMQHTRQQGGEAELCSDGAGGSEDRDAHPAEVHFRPQTQLLCAVRLLLLLQLRSHVVRCSTRRARRMRRRLRLLHLGARALKRLCVGLNGRVSSRGFL